MKILEAASKKRLKKLQASQEQTSTADNAETISQIESLLHKATQQSTAVNDEALVEAHKRLHRTTAPPIAP